MDAHKSVQESINIAEKSAEISKIAERSSETSLEEWQCCGRVFKSKSGFQSHLRSKLHMKNQKSSVDPSAITTEIYKVTH